MDLDKNPGTDDQRYASLGVAQLRTGACPNDAATLQELGTVFCNQVETRSKANQLVSIPSCHVFDSA